MISRHYWRRHTTKRRPKDHKALSNINSAVEANRAWYIHQQKTIDDHSYLISPSFWVATLLQFGLFVVLPFSCLPSASPFSPYVSTFVVWNSLVQALWHYGPTKAFCYEIILITVISFFLRRRIPSILKFLSAVRTKWS